MCKKILVLFFVCLNGLVFAEEYYVSFDFDQLEPSAWGNYVRIVTTQPGETTVHVDTSYPPDDIPEYTVILNNEEPVVEWDLPTGAHIWTDKPVSVVQYDDYIFDWKMVNLSPVELWGDNYWYAGIKSYEGAGRYRIDYLLITAAWDGTVVSIDLDHNGIPDKVINLNRGQVNAYGVRAVPGGNTGLFYMGIDPRAGAHITSNFPIQVHAYAQMDGFFGGGYLLLPTKALGTNHYVPFIPATLPSPAWDDGDRILVVGTQPDTIVKIDEDRNGLSELTVTIQSGQVLQYPQTNEPLSQPFLSGTRVFSDKPVGVVYTSPGGIYWWDGDAVQIVPQESSLSECWAAVSDVSFNSGNIEPKDIPVNAYIDVTAFEDNVRVYLDTDNDSVPEDAFILGKAGEYLKIQLQNPGMHIWGDKPLSIIQSWFKSAGSSISHLGYRLHNNKPPQANAGEDMEIFLPIPVEVKFTPKALNTSEGNYFKAHVRFLSIENLTAEVTLDGSESSDPDSTPGTNDDIIDFSWDVEGDGIEDAYGEVVNLIFSPGEYVIRLTVTDTVGLSSTDDIYLTINTVETSSLIGEKPNVLLFEGARQIAKALTAKESQEDGLVIDFDRNEMRNNLVPSYGLRLTLGGALTGSDTIDIIENYKTILQALKGLPRI